MFIQTETRDDGRTIGFFPGRAVLDQGRKRFADAEAASASPLAQRIFAVDGVESVTLDGDSIVVSRTSSADWVSMKPAVLGAIMQHFTSGDPVLVEAPEVSDAPEAAPADSLEDEADPEVRAKLIDLITTRIRPAVTQSGGEIEYKWVRDGILYLHLAGAGLQMKAGIENMLRHYLPEIQAVRDWRESLPKPGLGTDRGQAIARFLDERINPSVASHGGHIALVDVQDDRVFIRLEGGCHGCGMADVTLKQGVEVEIKRAFPDISAVLDVTDHASGNNPYYQA
ncbi:NifU family protein [Oceanibacterium hippocampi]|uniref:Fe/S biogenesis protein NfuA n=1 Tax=Oceanibacterium hippocampi TaxID=745714 RepID=A0A1Y5RUR5_9PROT|nr:NifU family protein [Oceanibacterium hippocampi]SLN25845.1 Fe/S biogenesis protein NfuA [Oceanibacterium hippocampi]